jgi:biopolymer transport protein ExbB
MHPTRFLSRIFTTVLLLAILGAPAQAWWKSEWTLRKKITIDTSSTGAPIGGTIGDTPVLIRLHDGDFQFASSKDDGSDIRFVAADDKTPLTYHVEKYDSLMGEAFVWVRIPDLKPGAVTTCWLYYGNDGTKGMPGGPDAKGTYDTDTALVYHFADGTNPTQDATGNGNNASNAGPVTDGSLIGPGLRLNGKVTITIPASSSLAWTAGQSLTWSGWVKLTSLAPNAVIFSRRTADHSFVIGADNGLPYVEIDGSRSAGGSAVAAGAWKHLAVVADGGKVTIYVDGIAAGSLAAAVPALDAPSLIGSDPGNSSAGAIVAELDELEISRTDRPPGFVQLAALGQGPDTGSKLVSLGADEQAPAGWVSGAFGLFGVILKSVTIDGWVVIGVLGIMSVVSWYVMVTKLFYLLAVEKGNSQFLREWRHVASDLTVLDHGDPDKVLTLGGRILPNGSRGMRRASLYRIYHIGAEEIAHRVASPASSRILSAQSIQAIRASLDSGYVRQNHALNGGLVFLTISIAGGPFMGLLGTCIGVMITFAAIAATGEVNISAIAPGLAAALVATVAGLLVAIPALLGYNYLVSRIKTITSEMQMFVDEFVTKMAEFYQPPLDRITELEVGH